LETPCKISSIVTMDYAKRPSLHRQHRALANRPARAAREVPLDPGDPWARARRAVRAGLRGRAAVAAFSGCPVSVACRRPVTADARRGLLHRPPLIHLMRRGLGRSGGVNRPAFDPALPLLRQLRLETVGQFLSCQAGREELAKAGR
jgi:hypothetical protein